MDMGARLKEARLALGLSQKQVCGDRITRNMLSLIENGAATPSMDTLQYLAQRLGKPVSYFLQEEVSANRGVLNAARKQPPVLAAQTLEAYEAPDPDLDAEYYYLTALTALRLARQALTQGKRGRCRTYLEQAVAAGRQTPYYTRELDRERLCLAYALQPEDASILEGQLLRDEGICLRAKAALLRSQPDICLQMLAGETGENADLLRAQAFFVMKDYENALKHYKKLPPEKQDYARMEACCRELEDFKQAYHYACLQR